MVPGSTGKSRAAVTPAPPQRIVIAAGADSPESKSSLQIGACFRKDHSAAGFGLGNRAFRRTVTRVMRTLILLVVGAIAAFAEPFSIGVKGGIPINDFVNGTNSSKGVLNSTTNRYIVGPELELNLPAGFGIEFDAMYRHYNFQGFGVSGQANTTTSTGAWEFPLLAKWRVPIPVVRPFIDGGVSWDHLTGTGVTASSVFPGVNNGPFTNNNTVFGYVGGLGIEFQAKWLRIEPEVRYTRWNDQHFISSSGVSTAGVTTGSAFSSNQNQLEVLVGFTFGGAK